MSEPKEEVKQEMILDTHLPKVNKPEYSWSRIRVADEEYIRELFESDLLYLE